MEFPVKYKLSLSDNEIRAIKFVASRGYAVAVADALDHEDTLTEPEDPNTAFYIPEGLTWIIQDELENNGGHHFGPLSDELTAKLYALVDQIV